MEKSGVNVSGLELFRRATRPRAAFSLSALMLLAACGGGDGDDGDVDGGPSSTTKQYPAGIWSGTSGDGQAVFGIVDPGASGVSGQSGFFYFARGGADATGYDGLYGNWMQSGAQFSSNSANYYIRPATTSGKGSFVTGLSVVNTVSGRTTAAWNTDTGTMSGRFRSPYNASSFITLSLSYDSLLSSRDSTLNISNGIQGAYRGDTSDGGGWALYIDWAGRLTGRSGNCRFYGNVSPRSDAANSGSTSPFYTVSMTLYNDFSTTTCDQAGSTLTGDAIVRYSSTYEKEGIWLATRSGSQNTFILDGRYLPQIYTQGGVAPIPRTFNTYASNIASAATNPIGVWAGKDPFSGLATNMIVLPNQQYLLYREDGLGDVLYSIRQIGMEGSNGLFYADNAVFWRNNNDTFYTGLHFAGSLRTESTGTYLRALFDDPSNSYSSTAINGLPSATEMTYVAPPSGTSASLRAALLSGARYVSDGASFSFGGRPNVTSLTISEIMVPDANNKPVGSGRYRLVAEANLGCKATALLSTSSSASSPNMFGVESLVYSNDSYGSTCAYTENADVQQGVIVVNTTRVNANNTVVASSITLATASAKGFTIFKGAVAQ